MCTTSFLVTFIIDGKRKGVIDTDQLLVNFVFYVMMKKSSSVRSVKKMSRKRERSFVKGRHKGWFALELILVISAMIVSIYNIIEWEEYSDVVTYYYSVILGLVFIYRSYCA